MLRDLTLLQQTKKLSLPPQLYWLKTELLFGLSLSSLQVFLEFFHGEEGGVEQNHLICERGHLIILICSGCYLGIHPNLKFQKINFSFRGAKSCLKQLRSINTTSPWHRRPLLHQRDKEVIGASCLGDSVQTASPATGRALLLGNWSAAVKEALHYLKKSTVFLWFRGKFSARLQPRLTNPSSSGRECSLSQTLPCWKASFQ